MCLLWLPFLAAASLIGALALVAMIVRFGREDDTVPAADPAPTPEEMRRHILWRSFYVNPDDRRGWVPRPNGFGTTVNFRSRRNATGFALVVGATLATALALVTLALCC